MLIKTDGDKVNFIDENDIYVGYDMSQSCCEHADWYLAMQATPYKYDMTTMDIPSDLSGYVFDIVIEDIPDLDEQSDIEDGGLVIFRWIHKEKPAIYLHIFNSHNGYYGHTVIMNLYGKVDEITL